MTQEEKAKAYDEALKEAVIAHKDEDRHLKATLERIFPELRESEDERIRKELIQFIKNWKDPNNIGRPHDFPTLTRNVEQCDKYIAWLEKQGEQKLPIEKLSSEMKTIGESLGFTTQEECNRYNQMVTDLIMSDDGKGEQKPFDYENANIQQKDFAPKVKPKFKVGQTIIYKGTENIVPTKMTISDIVKGQYWDDNCCIVPISDQDNWELVEQKPTDEEMKEALKTEYEKGRADAIAEMQKLAWSEEDESYLNTTIAYLKDAKEFKKTAENCINWLKSLKDRVQPQQEWSEDAEKIYKSVLYAFEHNYPLTVQQQKFVKSLRERYTWKPSNGQMKAPEHFVRSIGESGYASPYENNTKLLYSLLEQLKKLKEE